MHVSAFVTFETKYVAAFCMEVLRSYAFDDTPGAQQTRMRFSFAKTVTQRM